MYYKIEEELYNRIKEITGSDYNKYGDFINAEAIHNILKDLICETERLEEQNQKHKELIDKAIKYYESNQQECVIGRNKDEKLIKEYYLPAQCSKKMLDILKERLGE